MTISDRISFLLKLSLLVFSFYYEDTLAETADAEHRIFERASAAGCVVPANTKDRTFLVYDSNENVLKVSPGSVVPKLTTTLVTSCVKSHFLDNGDTTTESFCNKHGQWTPAIRTCRKACVIPPSDTVNVKCKRNNQDISCRSLLFTGTKAYLSCKPLHHPENAHYYFIECKNGEWDRPFFKCVHNCGQTNNVRGLVHYGTPATTAEFPWQVAIYHVRNNNNMLICGGTLISKTRVISAAHCFFSEELGKSNADLPHEYEVVVAKVTTNYSIKDNNYQQKFKLKNIITHYNEYNPSLTGHYGSDIILLQLERPVIISPYVLPACFAWGDRVGFNPGKNVKGMMAGWGITEKGVISDRLQAAQLPFISYNECSKIMKGVTNDKFCAGSTDGPKPSLGDSGGGLVFQNPDDKLFYLRGIVSTEDSSNNISVVTFTDVSNFREWIQTNYDEESFDATTKSETVTMSGSATTVPTMPPKPKPCPGLNPEFTDMKCYPNKQSSTPISCEGEQAPGTRIVQRCKPFYHKENDTFKTELMCKDNGEWDGAPLKCVVDCGYPVSSTTPLISLGKPVIFGETPWAVAIYRQENLVCSGTIITPIVVLTAASCFYNATEKRLAGNDTFSDYEIVVSKFSKDYKRLDSGSQKIYKVKEMIFNFRPTYNPGLTGVHAGDIAIVVPEKPFQISRFVLPACVAWNEMVGSFEPPTGALGTIAGWGPSSLNSSTDSDILLTADLPYLGYIACLGKLKHLTGEKFCAGDDRTFEGKTRGVDSGVGILFQDPRDKLYYVRGVSTVYEENVNSSISLFTDIQFFLPWIKRTGVLRRPIIY